MSVPYCPGVLPAVVTTKDAWYCVKLYEHVCQKMSLLLIRVCSVYNADASRSQCLLQH